MAGETSDRTDKPPETTDAEQAWGRIQDQVDSERRTTGEFSPPLLAAADPPAGTLPELKTYNGVGEVDVLAPQSKSGPMIFPLPEKSGVAAPPQLDTTTGQPIRQQGGSESYLQGTGPLLDIRTKPGSQQPEPPNDIPPDPRYDQAKRAEEIYRATQQRTQGQSVENPGSQTSPPRAPEAPGQSVETQPPSGKDKGTAAPVEPITQPWNRGSERPNGRTGETGAEIASTRVDSKNGAGLEEFLTGGNAPARTPGVVQTSPDSRAPNPRSTDPGGTRGGDTYTPPGSATKPDLRAPSPPVMTELPRLETPPGKSADQTTLDKIARETMQPGKYAPGQSDSPEGRPAGGPTSKGGPENAGRGGTGGTGGTTVDSTATLGQRQRDSIITASQSSAERNAQVAAGEVPRINSPEKKAPLGEVAGREARAADQQRVVPQPNGSQGGDQRVPPTNQDSLRAKPQVPTSPQRDAGRVPDVQTATPRGAGSVPEVPSQPGKNTGEAGRVQPGAQPGSQEKQVSSPSIRVPQAAATPEVRERPAGATSQEKPPTPQGQQGPRDQTTSPRTPEVRDKVHASGGVEAKGGSPVSGGSGERTGNIGDRNPSAADARATGRGDTGEKVANGRTASRIDGTTGKVADVGTRTEPVSGGKQTAGVDAKGGRAGDIPVVLPPGLPSTDIGGKGSRQPAGDGTSPASRPGDAAGSKSGPGASDGSRGASGESKDGRASGNQGADRAGEPGGGGSGRGGGGGGSGGFGDGIKGGGARGGAGEVDGTKAGGGGKDCGPGRSGTDGTKVAGDVRVSGDAAGRSGLDSGRTGAGTGDSGGAGEGMGPRDGGGIKDSGGTKIASGADGIKGGGRGIDIPVVLPPGLPGFNVGGRGGAKPGGTADGKGTGDSAGGRAGTEGTKGGIEGAKGGSEGAKGGVEGTKASAGTDGRMGADGTKVAEGTKVGPNGTRVGTEGTKAGADGIKPGSGPRDSQPADSKGGRPTDSPIVLPPGIPWVDFGGKGGAKSGGDKAGAGAGQPGDKGVAPAAAGDKGGLPGIPGKPGTEAGGKPGADGIKSGAKDGQTADGRVDRGPFIPVNIPPGYGFDQSGKSGPKGGADTGARPGAQPPGGQDAATPTARGDKLTTPGAAGSARTFDAPGAARTPEAPGATRGPDTAGGTRTPEAARGGKDPGDTSIVHKRDGAKDASSPTDKPADTRMGRTSSGYLSGEFHLPGLELTGKLDGGRGESTKPTSGRPLERDSAAAAAGDGGRVSDARYKPGTNEGDAPEDGDDSRSTTAGDKSTTDKLVDFVRNNRFALEQMMQNQGDLSAAMQEFVSIMRELDTAEAEQQAEAPVGGDVGEHTVYLQTDGSDAAEDEVEAGGGSVIGKRSRREHYRDVGGDEARQVYIVQPGDTLESIGALLFLDERTGALIHELNKQSIPSAYYADRIIVELKPNMALELPTYAEVEEFLEQIVGAGVPNFDYTQDLAETERELAAWEKSRQTADEELNPYASMGAGVIEGMFKALKRATEPAVPIDTKPESSDDIPALAE